MRPPLAPVFRAALVAGLTWAEVAARLGYASRSAARQGALRRRVRMPARFARAHVLEGIRRRRKLSVAAIRDLLRAGRSWAEIAQAGGYVSRITAMQAAPGVRLSARERRRRQSRFGLRVPADRPCADGCGRPAARRGGYAYTTRCAACDRARYRYGLCAACGAARRVRGCPRCQPSPRPARTP